MAPYKDLWQELCSISNLYLAFRKARKHKTQKQYVVDFEKELKENLLLLRAELLFHIYTPRPLKTFIIRDPKTRKISSSDFRDRVIHHAICNILEPIFEKTFIYDSYANRKGKGVLNAIKRFEQYKLRITKNNSQNAFVLKADIKHYFDTVNHNMLVRIIKKKIKDRRVLWLIRKILSNYQTKEQSKGMPLGNLTSQFFANIYLNELDWFIKQKLKIKHYIRYVDDFVIFHKSGIKLRECQKQIDLFLSNELSLQLHPDKTKIISVHRGTDFLGLKLFLHYRILKKKNLRRFKRKLDSYCTQYDLQLLQYDKIYDFLEGWLAYAGNANTHKLRKRILMPLEDKFIGDISTKQYCKYSKYLVNQQNKRGAKKLIV